MAQSWQLPDKATAEKPLLIRVIEVARLMMEETWQWCVDGPRCRLTRPMAVVLSQFWTIANVHSKGFRHAVGSDTLQKYF